METMVLEARDRVGGRVHSYSDGGFSGPVDLGASIITGTATVVARGTRPDPSTLVARHAALHFPFCLLVTHTRLAFPLSLTLNKLEVTPTLIGIKTESNPDW